MLLFLCILNSWPSSISWVFIVLVLLLSLIILREVRNYSVLKYFVWPSGHAVIEGKGKGRPLVSIPILEAILWPFMYTKSEVKSGDDWRRSHLMSHVCWLQKASNSFKKRIISTSWLGKLSVVTLHGEKCGRCQLGKANS